MLCRVHKYLTLPLSVVAVSSIAFAAYSRVAAERSITDALRAVSEGRAVPADTKLDILGMQVALQDPDRFRELLSRGFEVSGGAYMWGAFPRRAFVFTLDVRPDIGLVCETNAEREWQIFCGQLRCAEQPCIFSTRPDRLVPFGT